MGNNVSKVGVALCEDELAESEVVTRAQLNPKTFIVRLVANACIAPHNYIDPVCIPW